MGDEVTAGYRVDLPAMAVAAGRLDEAADEVRAAAGVVAETAGGDLGPGGLAAALSAVTDGWAARLVAAQEAMAATAAGVRAAADTYAEADDAGADGLRHGG